MPQRKGDSVRRSQAMIHYDRMGARDPALTRFSDSCRDMIVHDPRGDFSPEKAFIDGRRPHYAAKALRWRQVASPPFTASGAVRPSQLAEATDNTFRAPVPIRLAPIIRVVRVPIPAVV